MVKDCVSWVAATLCATTFGCHSNNEMAAEPDLASDEVADLTDSPPEDLAFHAISVLGQPDVSTNQNLKFGVAQPYQLSSAGGKLLVADSDNNRILIWSSIPTMPGTAADSVLGQTSLSLATTGATASATTLRRPTGVWTD